LKKKRYKRRQITCNCSAYNFPHRLSGGKCTLSKFANRTFEENYGSGICGNCNCFNNGICEVSEGIESPDYCEAIIEIESFHEIKLTRK